MSDTIQTSERSRSSTLLRVIASLVLLAIAGIASKAAGAYIVAEFPDRPMPRDALFELLPYVSSARYLTAVALVAGFAIVVAYAVRMTPDKIPAFISVFALMYLFRAAIMVLTPLASSYGTGHFVFPIVQYGMFPSGHAGAATLCTRLVDKQQAPRLRAVQTVLMLVVWVALVLAHGHYSIDVVGGALLAYFVEQEWSHGSLLDPFKRMVRCS